MNRVWFAARKACLVVAAGLQMALCYTLVLWVMGPLPLDTPCYVQSVSTTSATVCKVDRRHRTLCIDLLRDGRKVQSKTSGPATIHAARFDGLRPGTQYSYAVAESGAPSEPSHTGSFRTAPNDDREIVRFTAVGDSGDVPWWYNFHKQGLSRVRHVLAWTEETQQWEVARWIAAQDPHFFVHLGDIVYWPDLYDAHGEAFFYPFEPLLRRASICMMAGNHDVPAGGGPAPFGEIFHHPSPASAGLPQRNYTCSFGSVRLVVFDVATSTWNSAPMLAWLEKTLAGASEPWLVVATHRPCFSVYREEDPELRDRLWPLLRDYGVDLVLSGDDHHYARFRPVGPGATSPIQLIAGAGGKRLYEFNEDDPRLEPGKSLSVWSFLSFEAAGLQLHCRAMASPEKEIDSWTIDRRAGKLGPGIRPARRDRILKLRQ